MANEHVEDEGDDSEPAAHYPENGEVLGCDFRGLREPEMCKRRPVVILSRSDARPGLAIVIPLSTTPPHPVEGWHYQLSRASQWDRRERWAKCDMLYAVCYDRFFLWRLGRKPDGRRMYLTNFVVSDRDFAGIQAAALKALNIKV